MQLAQRVLGIQPSPTLAVTAKANELKAKGVDVVSFGGGEPDFPTPDHIKLAAIAAITQNFTRYTAVDGIPELKQPIVDKIRRDNSWPYLPTRDGQRGWQALGYPAQQVALTPATRWWCPPPTG